MEKKDNEALKKVLLKTLDHFLKVFLNTLYIISSKSLLKNLTQKKVNVGDFGRKNATLFTIDEVAHTFPHNTIGCNSYPDYTSYFFLYNFNHMIICQEKFGYRFGYYFHYYCYY